MLRRSFLAGVSLVLRKGQLDQAIAMIDKACESDVSAACLAVKQGSAVTTHAAGKARGIGEVFLLASITKPMTATAVMILADKGELKLSDPVRKFIPEFRGADRDEITLQMVLTHTSGLPDMLPENETLRKKHAPLSEFVAGTCKTPLLFAPGSQCKYQSMGILLAAEIVERITKTPLPSFLKKNIFDPLGMKDTSLGLGGRKISQTAINQVPVSSDWDWNSVYWRNFGAPWGGAHSNTGDLTRWLGYFLEPDNRVVKPETARLMITNQNAGLNELWGIGWHAHGTKAATHASARAFGHGGSTGTLCWADPSTNTSFIILTTKPADTSNKTLLVPVSNLVSGAAA